MEYGSITAAGLPAGWRVMLDSAFSGSPRLVTGSGLLRSKLRIPVQTLMQATRAEFVEGLVRPVG
jgi:prolyl-tRNA editing enzyme YbaK/EbsC (Cys-tRNA(Pro) deacylase)